jgi:hypothetical protein
MISFAHHAVVVIDTDRMNYGDCHNDDPNAAWDPDLKACFTLCTIHDNTSILDWLDEDVGQRLWNPDGAYGLDKLTAYRNAYHCWVDNGGKPKHPEVRSDLDVHAGEYPACYFPMTVIKGSYEHDDTTDDDWRSVVMSKFPGQEEGEDWAPGGD